MRLTVRCEWVEERLSAYRDGELSGAESPRVIAHLETCSICARALSRIDRLGLITAQMFGLPPSRESRSALVTGAAPAPTPTAAEWQACWQRVRAAAAFRTAGAVAGAGMRAEATLERGAEAASGRKVLRLLAWLGGSGAVAAAVLLAVILAFGPPATNPGANDTAGPGKGGGIAPVAAAAGPLLAFETGAGANACEVVELRTDAAYTPTIIYPANDSAPVLIWITRRDGS